MESACRKSAGRGILTDASGGDTSKAFQEGIDLFNRGEFYDCHERLEQVWMTAKQPDRWFLQALIHFAVGFHHHRRRNNVGAVRQLSKGLRKILGYLPEWGGVVTGELERKVSESLRFIESGGVLQSFPQIRQTTPWPGLRESCPTRKRRFCLPIDT